MLFLGVAQHTEREQRYNIYVSSERVAFEEGDERLLLRALPVGMPPQSTLWGNDVVVATAIDERFRRGVYRHYRGGFYQALGVAADESLVVYVSLTGAHMPGPRLRVRPLAMWEEMVCVDNCSDPDCVDTDHLPRVLRFEYVGDEIPEAMRPKEGT